ncbi:MAG: diguanylate cyclase [Scytonema sp. PMC 1069.18]|nr:diguanylate cyclase [Scytonema sp. PMC 1069.18]MEC4884552.1 diguanylate cyclase [Scytonema sp. PMC 1070.18]
MKLFHPENSLILIVDDVNDNLELVAAMLEPMGYKMVFASSGLQALKLVPVVEPDLILLDLMMPGMSGLCVCEKLTSNPETAEIPIIFLTASRDKENLLQAFEKGAVDYITKPVYVPELLARVRTHLELKFSREQLKKLASTDPLTGVWNRRYLFTLAEQELNRAQRYDRPFAVLIIDIDHFKRINDTYGHTVGDEAIVFMSQTVLNCLRKVDSFGRLGGEEFMALLPETDTDAAFLVAERIREMIENIVIPARGKQVTMTVCIGVASYTFGNDTVDFIIQRADEALYQAKNQGRNRVVANTYKP